jgi:hypothetical protein
MLLGGLNEKILAKHLALPAIEALAKCQLWSLWCPGNTVYYFYCLAGWGYIVAFTKVTTKYQICHTWIHLLYFSSFYLSPLLMVVPTGLKSSIFTGNAFWLVVQHLQKQARCTTHPLTHPFMPLFCTLMGHVLEWGPCLASWGACEAAALRSLS